METPNNEGNTEYSSSDYRRGKKKRLRQTCKRRKHHFRMKKSAWEVNNVSGRNKEPVQVNTSASTSGPIETETQSQRLLSPQEGPSGRDKKPVQFNTSASTSGPIETETQSQRLLSPQEGPSGRDKKPVQFNTSASTSGPIETETQSQRLLSPQEGPSGRDKKPVQFNTSASTSGPIETETQSQRLLSPQEGPSGRDKKPVQFNTSASTSGPIETETQSQRLLSPQEGPSGRDKKPVQFNTSASTSGPIETETQSQRLLSPQEGPRCQAVYNTESSSSPSPSTHSLIIESEEEKENSTIHTLEGRRIVDIKYLFETISKIKHEPYGCRFSDMEFQKEIRRGFNSKFIFKCNVCLVTESFTSEDTEKNFGVNEALVEGTICSGNGYSQLNEICAAANIPAISNKTFHKKEEEQWQIFEDCAWAEMKKAGEEEKRLALLNGRVDSDGVPLVPVVADGSWVKRSYNNGFSSLAGCACIVGYETKKVLFLNVRNKYCCICDRCRRTGEETIPEHKCFKNWDQSSTSMEEDIIAEGFLRSMEMHGVKYNMLIGDGDSSVISRLNQVLPYGPNLLVQKVECKNHMLRNFCTKLKQLSKKTNNHVGYVQVDIRKKLEANIMRLRKAIVGAINFRKNEEVSDAEKVQNLREDIRNSANHVFGYHGKCASYFCTKKIEANLVPELQKCGLWADLQNHLSRLVNNANSLILDVTNNCAEQFHAKICKFIGGKRVNYTGRGSYKARVHGAVISWNSKGATFAELEKKITSKSPGKYTKIHVERKARELALAGQRRKKRKLVFPEPHQEKRPKVSNPDRHYGLLELEEDMPDEIYNHEAQKFLSSLILEEDDRKKLEQNTIGQSDNMLWLTERRKRVTASRFGQICKMRPTSGPSVVNSMLYSNFSGNLATKHGKENESEAIRQFSELTGLIVRPCGMFIDKEKAFISASPDGIVGDDGIVEIKCPYSIKDMCPKKAIEEKKIKYCTLEEGKMILKRNDNYYYQVQGQMHVAEKKFAYFILWTRKGLLWEKIERDDQFWHEKIEPKLEIFYNSSLLPELVDPRKSRRLPLRECNFNPH